jgi:beta-1,4-mannosyltransferase
MQLQFQGFRTEAGSPVHEAVAATRYYTGRDAQEPWVYAYTPVARMNPYQALTYGAFGDHGLAVTPVTDPWSFESLMAVSGQCAGVVLHVHWLSFVFQDVTSAAQARQSSEAFMAKLKSFRARGGKLVWTVHNMVSHDARYHAEELALQQAVADEADLVHVLSADTPELVKDILRLDPDKLVVVPHPSYHGAYEDYVPRDHARMTLGLESDELVYVVFGAIKAYKGIEQLVEGFNELLARSDRPRRLIVAGGADQDPQTQEMIRQLRIHPYVLVHDVKVPGDRAQYLLRAADLMVLPHQRALNSGGALLGPTFDLPIVANRVGVLPGLLAPEMAEFFDDPAPGAIADALERADRLCAPEARRAAREFAGRYRPEAVSARLATEVKERLDLAPGYRYPQDRTFDNA